MTLMAGLEAWAPVALAIIGFIQLVFVTLMNRKANVIKADMNEMKITTAATAVSVEAAHKAINSERSEMQTKLQELHQTIVQLTEKNAHLLDKIPNLVPTPGT